MKQNLKQVVVAACLVATGFGISAGAALITNNVADFNKVTNTIAGGRWSYLDVFDIASTSTSVNPLGAQYAWSVSGSAPWNNWCVSVDASGVWCVINDGGVITDNRAMGWAYTADTNGDVQISGSYGGATGWSLAIYKTTDTDVNRVDMSTKQLLFSATPTDPSGVVTIPFNLPTTLQPGNDIVFVSTGGSQYWFKRTLDASISTVPEPAALSLLALGGLVLFRRRQ